MPNKLKFVLSPEKLFLVLTKDGKKQFTLADSEDDLPINIADVAFAASLAELVGLVDEMKKIMELSADDNESGIILRADNKGASQ